MANPFDFSQFGFETPNFEMPDFEAIQQGQVQGQQGQGAVSTQAVGENGGGQPGPTAPPSADLGGGFGNFDFGNFDFGNMFGSNSNGGGATNFLGGGGNDFLNNFLNSATPTIPSFTQPAPTPAPAPAPTPAAPAPAAPAPKPTPAPAPAPAPAPKPKPAPAPAPAPKPKDEPDGPEYQAFDREAWEAQYDKDNPFSYSPGSGEESGPKTRMIGENGGGNRMAGQGLTNIMSKDQYLKNQKKGSPMGGNRYEGMTKQQKHNSQNDAYNKYRANLEARNNDYAVEQQNAQDDHDYAKKSAMYEAMDAHKEKYGERPEDAAWKSFDEKAFKERFDHENKGKYNPDYDSALSQAKSDYTAKYGDGGEIGKLTQMVESLQAQLGESQGRGQSGDGGYSNYGSNLGMGGDSQASTRAVGENGGGGYNRGSGSSKQRQGAGGRTYRDNMQANTGSMQNADSGKEARERAFQAKLEKRKR